MKTRSKKYTLEEKLLIAAMFLYVGLCALCAADLTNAIKEWLHHRK
jgi:hypothetical protein